jgi:hypothetical protein
LVVPDPDSIKIEEHGTLYDLVMIHQTSEEFVGRNRDDGLIYRMPIEKGMIMVHRIERYTGSMDFRTPFQKAFGLE